jgi:HlyD family secretion protein
MKTYRWWIIIAVVAVVALLIAYGFLPRAVAVDAAKAGRGHMIVTVDEEGKTRVKEKYVISSPVSGFMRRIRLEAGDAVKKGQVVVELEPLRSSVLDPRSRAEAEAAVLSADAALKAAEENSQRAAAEAEYAKANLVRIKKLFEQGYVSKDEMEHAETEAKRTEAGRLSAEAAVKVARFELDKARSVLQYSADEGGVNRGRAVALRSPVDGRILKLYRESEGVVNSGDALIDIGDPDKLEVRVEVLSADAVKIKPGTPVLFKRWGGEPVLSGMVRIIEPAGFTKISSLGVEEQRVVVIADITSANEGKKNLGDGYRVEASFVIWEGKDVLQIPASALFRKGEAWAVFVVKNKRANQRQIEIGHRNGLAAEVLSGLTEGEEVITHPDDSIKEGTRVRKR